MQFSNIKSDFLKKLEADTRKINNSKNVFILGDKTPNVYEVSPDKYKQLLHNSITTHYRKADCDTELEINREAQQITINLQIADRVDKMSQEEAFITLKNHKENFQNNPKVRLINPAKTQIGKISKQYLQEINAKILELINLNQWNSTMDVIKWYNKIENKSRMTFLQLDIVDFYPSISEELLNKSISFASKN